MTATQLLNLWLILFVTTGIAAGICTGYFQARKIQKKGFRWKLLRNEAMFAAINLLTGGALIGFAMRHLTAAGIIHVQSGPAAWWIVALEYVAYFFGFDTWFYWLHRWMHKEPVYSWVHKLHHRSTSPNPLTTLSVNPIESVINGGFVPLFLSIVHVHSTTLALIVPTNIIMGIYVHTGFEFLPRWWNRSWATKWFISTSFHDQHHQYFRYNFGGYTTIWDWICGTVRPKFVTDFEKPRVRTGGTIRVVDPAPEAGLET